MSLLTNHQLFINYLYCHITQQVLAGSPRDSWKWLHEDLKISVLQTRKENPKLKYVALIITSCDKTQPNSTHDIRIRTRAREQILYMRENNKVNCSLARYADRILKKNDETSILFGTPLEDEENHVDLDNYISCNGRTYSNWTDKNLANNLNIAARTIRVETEEML